MCVEKKKKKKKSRKDGSWQMMSMQVRRKKGRETWLSSCKENRCGKNGKKKNFTWKGDFFDHGDLGP